MASSSNNMNTSQEGLKNQSSQVVAVYRFVIGYGKVIKDVDPTRGVWISKNTSNKDYTYTARLVAGPLKATFRCAYSDAGVLETLEILDINDGLRMYIIGSIRRLIHEYPMIKVGGHLEVRSPEKAGDVADKQIKDDEEPFSRVGLGISSQVQVSPNDDNGNQLLLLSLTHYPNGIEGSRQVVEELGWAKKEVSGKPITALSDAELMKFKYDGKVEQMARAGVFLKTDIPSEMLGKALLSVHRAA